jgi:DNA-binding HxlR family transcriptional regulator
MSRTISPLCSEVADIFDLIGKKRVVFILKALSDGHDSFMDIRRYISNPSAKILTERLDELGKVHLIERRILSPKPLKIRYYLTPRGKELADICQHIASWCHQG